MGGCAINSSAHVAIISIRAGHDGRTAAVIMCIDSPVGAQAQALRDAGLQVDKRPARILFRMRICLWKKRSKAG
jgi:hypothetical protein